MRSRALLVFDSDILQIASCNMMCLSWRNCYRYATNRADVIVMGTVMLSQLF